MSDLIQKIRQAQVNAGEQAVIESLHEQGLLSVEEQAQLTIDMTPADRVLQTRVITALRACVREYTAGGDLAKAMKGAIGLLAETNQRSMAVNEDGTIHGLTTQIVAWADKRFPNRTPDKAFLKMFEEMGELVADPSSPGEYADVLIMLFDLANMHGVDPAKAIRDKLAVLEGRTEWKANELGVFQHVEPDAAPKPQPGTCGKLLVGGILCTRPSGAFCEGCL